jgi:hypothetical protein
MSIASDKVSPAEAATELDPIDQEWLRRRSALGPLAFGVIGLVTSPLLLGLAFGALGMRAGIDLWRQGTRRAVVVVGISASFVAVVTSIIAALLWGSVLTTVLLGRDAMRETERWRGRTIEPVAVSAVTGSGAATTIPLRPSGGAARTVLLFVRVDSETSHTAAQAVADALSRNPSIPSLLIDPLAPADAVLRFARASGLDATVIGQESTLPEPLDSVAAFPTIVVIDAEGRIEAAIVGSRSSADLDPLLKGPGAPPTMNP